MWLSMRLTHVAGISSAIGAFTLMSNIMWSVTALVPGPNFKPFSLHGSYISGCCVKTILYGGKQTTSLMWTPLVGPKFLILYKNDFVNQSTSLIRTLFGDATGGLISEVPLYTTPTMSYM